MPSGLQKGVSVPAEIGYSGGSTPSGEGCAEHYTVNRLFLAGHGDLEKILSVTAREPDRPRSLLIMGVQA